MIFSLVSDGNAGIVFLQKFFGKCGGVLDFWMCVIYDENI